jgi:hypothetical protein
MRRAHASRRSLRSLLKMIIDNLSMHFAGQSLLAPVLQLLRGLGA